MIVGPRQSGKTTFLKAHLPQNANYLLFDDPDIRTIFEEDIKNFDKQYINGKEIVILDEIQYAKDPGQKLKYLTDTDRKLWITSSSEILLGKKVLSYLVGRVSILRLYPFNIKEFLSAKNIQAYTPQMLRREVEEHTVYGGYPKVLLTKDIELKKTLLKDLYETMILKDIARTFSISAINSLEKFTEYLALNTGTQLSYDSIAQTIKISFQTIKKYLDAMEKSYLITVIRPFFTNKNKELSKQPKIYMLDTGLRNIIIKDFKVNGKIFENYILTELIKYGYAPKYWRTKTKLEVDFIIEKENEIIPIEVKLTETKIGRGLKSFIELYSPKRAYIAIFNGEEKTIHEKGCIIKFVKILSLKKEITS